MLDVRVYRAAFAPALIALFVAAFSLADRPGGATTPFAPAGFDGGRAYTLLGELGKEYPKRPPGSDADRALADRVAETFRANSLRVSRRTTEERTVRGKTALETVVGVRPGLSSRRIVVMAHRDSLGSPALAELSGTATLLELARLFKVRELSSTLVLVSTSGGSAGAAGARAFAEDVADDPIDAAIVLGDVAGRETRKPWIVPWSNGEEAAPMAVRRTLESAVRREVGVQAGGSRAIGQWARRALPLTVSEQGEAARAGLPAVLLQASGELGPKPDTEVSENRIDAFGRAALRSITALDGLVSRAGDDGAFADEPSGIVTVKRLLPDWAIRLLVGTLLLPPLLTAFDGFFGARRRHLPVARWLGWVGAAAAAVRARLAVDAAARADRRARRAARAGAAGGAAAAGLEHRRAGLRPARARARVDRRRSARWSAGSACPPACPPAAPQRRSGSRSPGSRRSCGWSTRSRRRCWCRPRTAGCSPPRPARRCRAARGSRSCCSGSCCRC